MDTAFLIELYGYLGSTLVVVSMLMASVVKLRVVNTIGSIVSGTYALIIGSFPLALMNGCLIVINIYNLFKLLKTEQKYDLLPCNAKDSFVRLFMDKNLEDIQKYFTDFDGKIGDADVVYMVLCEDKAAGILMGRDMGSGIVDVVIDYTTPAYRDCSVGAFLYAGLVLQGINKLVFSQSRSESHTSYLNKMGFVEEQGTYTKTLA